MNKEIMFAGIALGIAGLLNVLMVTVFDAQLAPSTVVLAVVAAALIYALRSMFSIVTALARPDLAAALHEQRLGHGTREELRDEQKRVLKAIKELDFDHDMGKLSDEDHRELSRVYRVRAVELMRAVDGGGELHPEVERLARGATDAPAPPPAAKPEPAPAPALADAPEGARPQSIDVPQKVETDGDAALLACAACGGDNEPDAKFCKHCGKAVAP